MHCIRCWFCFLFKILFYAVIFRLFVMKFPHGKSLFVFVYVVVVVPQNKHMVCFNTIFIPFLYAHQISTEQFMVYKCLSICLSVVIMSHSILRMPCLINFKLYIIICCDSLTSVYFLIQFWFFLPQLLKSNSKRKEATFHMSHRILIMPRLITF